MPAIIQRAVLIPLVALLLLLSACEQDQDKSEPTSARHDPQWSEYISGHTPPVASKKTKFQVRFVHDAVGEDKVGQDASAFIEISPAIAGSASFKTPRELQFIPDAPLASGQAYHVKVRTDKLLDFPPALKTFDFQVTVIEQAFEVTVSGLSSARDDELVLAGVLETADVEAAERVEQVLTARYQGDTLPVTWQHHPDAKHHAFSIAGIKRQKREASLQLSWDGAAIEVQNQGEHSVPVPAIGVFEVSRVKAVQDQRQYIQVYFSDILDPRQDLKGLVRIGSQQLSTRIEGSILKVYPDATLLGEVELSLEPGIRTKKGGRLGKAHTAKVTFTSQKPQVRFAGQGVILPENDKLSIPFEALNVDSVQVTAFRVYEDNIGQFLQTNTLDGGDELARVGRYLWRKTIQLGEGSGDKWNRYSLDATELLNKYPGALFRLTLSINRSNSIYSCPESAAGVPVPEDPPLLDNDDQYVEDNSNWAYYEEYYVWDSDSGEWVIRDDPCEDPYYKYADGTKDARNFIASDIGISAKRGVTGKVHVVTTALSNTEPMSGVGIDIMNFQDQRIGSGRTDASGMARIEVSGVPFYLVARQGDQRGYLKLTPGSALPTSHFDAGGETVKEGIKGHIYAERGVWRPGDDIYLTFVLQDKNGVIPAGHPVSMQLVNPKGQVIQNLTNNQPVGDFYAFKLKTPDDGLTGNWSAKAQLGGASFSKVLKIETVMPNRLKVELDFEEEILRQSSMPFKARLFAQWLHGAKASELDADVAVRLVPRRTRFKRFTDYVFDDPARVFSGERETFFEGTLDEEGFADIERDLPAGREAPGMLSARFTTRVFERGGAFSTSASAMPYSPFENYVGIKLPPGDAVRGMLLTDTDHTVNIASLSEAGEPVSLDQVQVTLYKIDWKWWWDKSGDSLAQYASATHASKLQQGIVSTKDGQGEWRFQIKYPDWGRYLIRACDLEGQHCTGKILYVDWPGWAGRAQEGGGAGASVLSFFSDKPAYEVGETAHIQLPEATQGRALLSVENGSRILEQRWVEFAEGKTRVDLPISAQMSPNIYVSITLVQPHRGKDNDRPIRLYGIIPIKVKDPATHLHPELKADDEWKPKSKAAIEVSEKDGRAMTYTVAVVDEGLLGLTRFKTPDLHKRFYRKEALGVRTWDVFDSVVGAYGGELERLLQLGGGEGGEDDEQADKKRFPPVVRFLGPFTLEAGGRNTHEIDLPQYIGAVRVMVVAGEQGAYGLTDKSVFVREPLSLLATLPRVIGPEEELSVPVALFAMKPEIKDVTLKIETDEHFEVIGEATRSIRFDEPGEQMGVLRLRVRPQLGKGSVRILASGNGHSSETQVHIDVRSANPRTQRQLQKTLQPGETWTQRVEPHGLAGSNRVSVELSAVPPISLERRLDYLIRYPHGCVEQVTSAVFPQLYLPALTPLDDTRKNRVQGNVQNGIARLRQFQTSDGGFMYWPGNGRLNTWATNYVGHFLIEAGKLGYNVPPQMMADWLYHQERAAQAWVTGSGQAALDQTYRLYTLALAGKPQIGAMNRLRESDALDTAARWQLAAAYQLAGLASAAEDLVAQNRFDLSDYRQPGETFGSRLRDEAIVLDALARLKRSDKAREFAEAISRELSADKWHSTQSVAYALFGISSYITGEPGKGAFTAEQRIGEGAFGAITADTPIYSASLEDFPETGESVSVKNTSDKPLYAGVLVSGVPRAGEEQAASHNLGLEVRYMDLEGNTLDVSELTQGTDFIARIVVANKTDFKLENIALSHILPSGWEIHNPRFAGDEQGNAEAASQEMGFDYQDVRDDRLYTYFGLKPGERKLFTVLLNASYLGRYYLPAVSVEAMYDASRQARTRGQWVEVKKP